MLSSFVATHALPVLHVVTASEAGGEEGGTYWTAYIIGVVVLLMFTAMVFAVMSIGRGRDNL